jgi:phosphopantetheinyl transferase
MTPAAAADGPDGLDLGALVPGRPRVWLFDVRASWFDDLAELEITSAAEQARAAALADAGAARRLLARRCALWLVLGRHLAYEPSEVRIVTAPGGKPVLVPGQRVAAGALMAEAAPARADRTIAFSIAHSGDLYGIAVGAASSLGLDLERLREVPRARGIADRWFAPAEAARLEGLDEPAMLAEFMRLWTGKEALAKRHGAGLRLMSGHHHELDVEGALESGRLQRFAPGEGYAGAVAATEVIEEIEVVRPRDGSWAP